ncbi:MAG: MFS transporter, partial [Psychrobacter sp.]|nr:MFS transporter [Psychrobacter sp.]
RQLIIVCISGIIIGFNLLIYFRLADIIGVVFFPISHEISYTAKLLALGVFTSSYLSRPFGALLLGQYGDIKGRKPAILMVFIFTAIPSIIMAGLPAYSQIGMLAPIIFILLRLAQGMVYGVFTPLGLITIAEQASPKTFYTYGGLVSACFLLGKPLADLFFIILDNTYSYSEIINGAWRIPFVCSASLSLICIGLWRYLDETPLFKHDAYANTVGSPPVEATEPVRNFHAAVVASILVFVISSLVMVIALMLPSLTLLTFNIDPTLMDSATLAATISLIVGCVVFGVITDKIGVGKVLMLGSSALIALVILFYSMLKSSGGDYLYITYSLLGFCAGIIAPLATVIIKLFSTKIRLTFYALVYNCVYAIVGGILPMGLFYVTNRFGFFPELYLIFIGLITFTMGYYFNSMPRLTLRL